MRSVEPTPYRANRHADLFGNLPMTISYYIDALTICMFTKVTLIASCIHFYASGYMHDELHDITDHEVIVTKGRAHAHGHSHGNEAAHEEIGRASCRERV